MDGGPAAGENLHLAGFRENREMRCWAVYFRSLCVLAGLAAAIGGCAQAGRAQDGKIGVSATVFGGAAPTAVVAGATATAKLAAWVDFRDLPPTGTPTPKSSWSWHITNVEYSSDGKAFGKPAEGQTHSATLSDPASTNTDLRFQGAPGYWRVSYDAGLVRTDAAGKISTGTSSDKAITFIVVEAKITVWNDTLNGGQGDWGNSAEIAAGAIDSQVHQTDVFITVWPAVAAEVPVTLHGGAGHPADAKIQIGEKTIAPNQTQTVETDSTGHLIGVLTSSDVVDGKAVTVTGGGGSAAVTFATDNEKGGDKWYRSPPYFIAGSSSNLTVKYAHNGRPMAGHKILLVVSKVEYTGEDGKSHTLLNTPEHPQDLAEWAAFDEPDGPTDNTGAVYGKVYYKDKCAQATNVELTAYDMTIYLP